MLCERPHRSRSALHSFPVSPDSALAFVVVVVLFVFFFFKHLNGEGFELQKTKPHGLAHGSLGLSGFRF